MELRLSCTNPEIQAWVPKKDTFVTSSFHRQLMDEVVYLSFDTESWDGSAEASTIVLNRKNSQAQQDDSPGVCSCWH